ncbi:MAG TPA: winged helix DNA-binding protein [Candidatus Thermoplasmatota archaeon]|nr:winged helix DNA-binding protein [Candidatus Thermoplasmatota archaeon]
MKETEALALWCLGERGNLQFAELQQQTGTEASRLRRAIQALVRKRLVRKYEPEERETGIEEFRLTRRGRCVYDLLRTLESHVAAA